MLHPNYHYHNTPLKDIIRKLPPLKTDELEVSYRFFGHHQIWVAVIRTSATGEVSYDTRMIMLHRYSPRNLAYYQQVWDDLYHYVGDVINARFDAYKTMVYIHTGHFIINRNA